MEHDDNSHFEAIKLERKGRLLTITLNSPTTLNAVGPKMHEELARVFSYANADAGSDVVLLTGSGRAFSAGGDMNRMREVYKDPSLFEQEAADARRIVFSLLDLEKPLVAKVNGHAAGLGATIALLCDVIFAAEDAKIGDPHVSIGLVAGDGGAVIWPQLIGFARAKEFLMTGEMIPAPRAAEMGLINYAVPGPLLDERVSAFCEKLLAGATDAIRWTKVVTNLELKRIASLLMTPGLAYEAQSVRTPHHRERVEAFISKRKPQFNKS